MSVTHSFIRDLRTKMFRGQTGGAKIGESKKQTVSKSFNESVH